MSNINRDKYSPPNFPSGHQRAQIHESALAIARSGISPLSHKLQPLTSAMPARIIEETRVDSLLARPCLRPASISNRIRIRVRLPPRPRAPASPPYTNAHIRACQSYRAPHPTTPRARRQIQGREAEGVSHAKWYVCPRVYNGMAIKSHITGRPHIPEHLLLRDTLYLLQGISGKYIRLSVSDDPEQSRLIFVEDSVRSSFFLTRHKK